ncbi:unnamed protein product [Pleuronectes platessa]|uniref:Uncharacterized protein n=1 Tax=Pleuronectes platessa TaxID=8262 RepID=A0A9N7UYW3_PLEPL|nr:unnamed protein product [Pleuronectes platessa]
MGTTTQPMCPFDSCIVETEAASPSSRPTALLNTSIAFRIWLIHLIAVSGIRERRQILKHVLRRTSGRRGAAVTGGGEREVSQSLYWLKRSRDWRKPQEAQSHCELSVCINLLLLTELHGEFSHHHHQCHALPSEIYTTREQPDSAEVERERESRQAEVERERREEAPPVSNTCKWKLSQLDNKPRGGAGILQNIIKGVTATARRSARDLVPGAGRRHRGSLA